jgi:ADP-ribosyl-[dinitrogen reductase] hydrolase
MSSIALASRLAGGIWGHLVGDATGVPYEFRRPEDVGRVVFGAEGTHAKPAGTWSDDGALMLALLDSLERVGFDPDDQGRRALAWNDQGAYTPDLEGRFDIGNATMAALSALRAGTPAIDAGRTDEQASSNGSLMRILPLALVERDVPDDVLVEHAHLASRVTHGHPRCQVACALYCLVVRRLLRGWEPADALESARTTLRDPHAGEPFAAQRAALDEIEAFGDAASNRSGSGFIIDSFWSAWDAFAEAADYAGTIERAIHYGNDTDTTAAIAGGLAGVHWGWEGIPAAWRRGMRGGSVATPLIDRLVESTGAMTSTVHPLRVDLLDLAGLGLGDEARLGITFLLGKKRDGWTGPHWRDLPTDAVRLRELGVGSLLLLNEDEELAYCMVPDVAEVVTGTGVELVRFPIRDPRTPTDHPAFAKVIRDLVERLRAGSFVAIACRGGLDRSGMAAACVLIEAGLDREAAIDRVHAARAGSLTYGEQLDYLRESWDRPTN